MKRISATALLALALVVSACATPEGAREAQRDLESTQPTPSG